MEELKPCPFCRATPVIKWEAWKDISEDCGVFALNVTHERNCFFSRMCGLNMETRMIADDEETLVETWNTRKGIHSAHTQDSGENYYADCPMCGESCHADVNARDSIKSQRN